jgi:branched-chain amino acid transport system ATP-binding protein
MTDMLTLTGISSGYGSQLVLRDVSLTVPRGTVVGLVGPNGHGKTTLLRTISGLIRLRGGQISAAGRRIDTLDADEIVALGIVHVPQGDLLFPDMTVLENLRMGAYLPAAATRMKHSLDEVFTLLPKLRDRQNQVAGTLSGGERRMVGIGRGLMASSDLLMLDEPSLGLAPIIIDQIYEVVQTLKSNGKTLVVVEENAMRIAEIADSVHLLDNGTFAWSGTAADFLSSPEILSSYFGG